MTPTQNTARLHEDILRVARTVSIVEDDVIVIGGLTHVIDSRARDAAADGFFPRLGEHPLVAPVAQLIYSELYAKAEATIEEAPRVDIERRVLSGALSNANRGTGAWEHGWKLTASDGANLVVEKDGLKVYARKDQFRASGGLHDGCVGALQVGKEMLNISPGFYFALGDNCDEASDSSSVLVRVYLNLTSSGAVPFISEVTTRLNGAGIPFRAKVLSEPRSFTRTDAAVVYLGRDVYVSCVDIWAAIWTRLTPHLRVAHPPFTKRVANGVGVAESPRGRDSFGQACARAIATALVSLRANGESSLEAHLVAAMRCDELDPSRPYVRPGHPDVYDSWD